MIEGVDTLYRWTPGEPSEYKPQGRIETSVCVVSNCINKDSWKLCVAQQGISDFYDTYSTQMSYGKSDEKWVLRRAWNDHAKIYGEENRNVRKPAIPKRSWE